MTDTAHLRDRMVDALLADGSITAKAVEAEAPALAPAHRRPAAQRNGGRRRSDAGQPGGLRPDPPLVAGHLQPEISAFGGPIGITAAHDLFTADTRAILTTPASTRLGRRELSILLCTTMMRAAGLEWYELGDAWHRVASERPQTEHPNPARLLCPQLAPVLAARRTPRRVPLCRRVHRPASRIRADCSAVGPISA